MSAKMEALLTNFRTVFSKDIGTKRARKNVKDGIESFELIGYKVTLTNDMILQVKDPSNIVETVRVDGLESGAIRAINTLQRFFGKP